jgi:LL-H family phage holin
MRIANDFLSQYGMIFIYTLLTAVFGFLGAKLKKILENREDENTKEKVVRTCVKAVEQLYKDLDGPEKLQKAKENITAMLSSKGIDISDIEMDMLIEACVAEFNFNFKGGNNDDV